MWYNATTTTALCLSRAFGTFREMKLEALERQELRVLQEPNLMTAFVVIRQTVIRGAVECAERRERVHSVFERNIEFILGRKADSRPLR